MKHFLYNTGGFLRSFFASKSLSLFPSTLHHLGTQCKEITYLGYVPNHFKNYLNIISSVGTMSFLFCENFLLIFIFPADVFIRHILYFACSFKFILM
jgi:hypothetical protein